MSTSRTVGHTTTEAYTRPPGTASRQRPDRDWRTAAYAFKKICRDSACDNLQAHGGGGGIFDDDDAALRESVPSAEREKIWATDDRAKGFAGGCRGLVIIQGYAREHALLDIVRERLDRERLNLTLKRERLQGDAKCRRHR